MSISIAQQIKGMRNYAKWIVGYTSWKVQWEQIIKGINSNVRRLDFNLKTPGNNGNFLSRWEAGSEMGRLGPSFFYPQLCCWLLLLSLWLCIYIPEWNLCLPFREITMKCYCSHFFQFREIFRLMISSYRLPIGIVVLNFCSFFFFLFFCMCVCVEYLLHSLSLTSLVSVVLVLLQGSASWKPSS